MAQDHIARIIADTRQFDAKITASMRVLQSLNGYIREVGESNAQLNSTERDVVQSMGMLETSARTTKGTVKQLEEMLLELTNTYSKLSAKTRQEDWAKDMANSIDQLKGRLASAKEDLASMGNVGGGSMVGSVMKGMSGAMIAVKAAEKAMKLFVQASKYAINTNMDFEQSNANLAAVLGTTRGKIGEMTEQAKKLGATTQYTAGEIVGLQTELARLGFDSTQIKAMTEDITNLAIATGIDLSRSASIAGSAIRAFNLPASEASRVASVLAVATTKSALTMEKLGTGLPYVAAAAKQFGFTIEDTVALMGTLTDAGFQATTAGVAVRNIMRALANDSSKLSKAMGMPVKTLDDFIKGLKKMKQDGANLNDIANIIEVRVSPALSRFADAADSLENLRSQLSDCEEGFGDMVDEMKDTAKFAKTEMKSAWDSLMLTFENTNDTLKEMYQWFTKIIKAQADVRSINIGGDSAISVFEKGADKKAAKDMYDIDLRAYNGNAKAAYRSIQYQIDLAKKKYDKRYALFQLVSNVDTGVGREATEKRISLFDQAAEEFGFDRKRLGSPFMVKRFIAKKLAKDKDWIATLEKELGYAESALSNDKNKPGEGADYANIKLREETEKNVNTALNNYELAIRKAALEKETGYINEKEYNDKILQADKMLLDAYTKAYATVADENYKKNAENQAQRIREMSLASVDAETKKKVIKAESKYATDRELLGFEEKEGIKDQLAVSKKRLSMEENLYQFYSNLYAETKDVKWLDRLKDLSEAIADWTKTIEEQEAEMKRQQQIRSLDKRTLNGLMGVARSQKIGYSDVGIGGQMDRIMSADNFDIPDSDWDDVVAKLNKKLREQGVRWYVKVDFETGTIEKMRYELDIAMERFGKRLGAVKSIAGAFDSVVQAGKNLAETLQGDANAWDKMMAILNATMAPLEAIVTLYNAINVLTELGTGLTLLNTGAKAANTTATETQAISEGAEVITKEASTLATEEEAAANVVDATTKTMNAHSWIPYVGIALGAAMVATMIATLATSKNQAKNTCYFSEGGIAGEGSFVPKGGDVLPSMLTPGELILTKAMQNNLAPQLQSGGLGNLRLSTEIKGDRLLVMLKETVRSHGGSGTQFNIR